MWNQNAEVYSVLTLYYLCGFGLVMGKIFVRIREVSMRN